MTCPTSSPWWVRGRRSPPKAHDARERPVGHEEDSSTGRGRCTRTASVPLFGLWREKWGVGVQQFADCSCQSLQCPVRSDPARLVQNSGEYDCWATAPCSSRWKQYSARHIQHTRMNARAEQRPGSRGVHRRRKRQPHIQPAGWRGPMDPGSRGMNRSSDASIASRLIR